MTTDICLMICVAPASAGVGADQLAAEISGFFQPCTKAGFEGLVLLQTRAIPREFENWKESEDEQADPPPPYGSLFMAVKADSACSADKLIEAMHLHSPNTIGGAAAGSELFATAPCRIPLLRPIDRTVYSLIAATKMMETEGMCVFAKSVRGPILDQLRALTAKRIHDAMAALKHKEEEGKYDSSSTNNIRFKEMSWRGNRRFDLLFDPQTVAWADLEIPLTGNCEQGNVLRSLAWGGPWIEVVKARLGVDGASKGECWQKRLRILASVVQSTPGATSQDWHSDGSHQGRREAGWDGTGASLPYALCVFIPLVDLNDVSS